MIFRWNNEWQAKLSVSERQKVLRHEFGHVVLAKASDGRSLSDDLKNQAMKEIRDFSRGYPCPEPLPDGLCILRFPAPAPKDWKMHVGYVINGEAKRG